MTADKIKSRLLEFCTLLGFDYLGKRGYVDPFNQKKFILFYDGKSIKADNIEDVMSIPFFGEKSLNEIYNEIEIDEW